MYFYFFNQYCICISLINICICICRFSHQSIFFFPCQAVRSSLHLTALQRLISQYNFTHHIIYFSGLTKINLTLQHSQKCFWSGLTIFLLLSGLTTTSPSVAPQAHHCPPHNMFLQDSSSTVSLILFGKKNMGGEGVSFETKSPIGFLDCI